jgi:Tannase-like family of unknown function (DUF6351)
MRAKPLSHSVVAATFGVFAFFILACLAAQVSFARRQSASASALEIQAVSSRPDMVSGGDALVQIKAPAGSRKKLKVTVNGTDVTASFKPDANGALLGLVANLKDGRNEIRGTAGGAHASLTLVNHPVSGPVFSGPHQKPFVCETEMWAAFGLGKPADADCSAPTAVRYFYKTTEPPAPLAMPGRGAVPAAVPAGFKPYDPAAPRPADMVQTTIGGKAVDYIVRVETGTVNRAVYQIAFLHQPNEPLPTPWASVPTWNGRLVYTFGGGCAPGYHQARSNGGVLNNEAIADGYAVASASLNVLQNNCNDVLSAETTMMVKEHFAKTFGAPVHTIGQGGSGGAMQQHLIAENYPGVLDGIMPMISFPDTLGETQITADCALLNHYFSGAPNWSEDQRTAVAGYVTWQTCKNNVAPYTPAVMNPGTCDPSVRPLALDPTSNPNGVRCTYADNEVNVYGRDPQTGFARRPYDNVGVQYGLAALNSGQISADQFLDLNSKIGGFDINGNYVSGRHAGDPEALRSAYETGRFNGGAEGLATTPIIDLRTYTETNDVHDRIRSFIMRERLKAANGNADNQVMLTLPRAKGSPFAPDPQLIAATREALKEMDTWLDNIAHDASATPIAAKVAKNKPAELADACWNDEGEKIVEPAVYGQPSKCNDLYPTHADPRIVAGSSMRNEMIKCQLKPLNRADYSASFTPDQWNQLQSAFPGGVCDYSKPGVGETALRGTWIDFSRAQAQTEQGGGGGGH